MDDPIIIEDCIIMQQRKLRKLYAVLRLKTQKNITVTIRINKKRYDIWKK